MTEPSAEAMKVWQQARRTYEYGCNDYEAAARVIETAFAERDAAKDAEIVRLEIDLTPWENYHGDLPDYDHSLRGVFESGIQYAVRGLATVLGVDDYTPCDGTEDFDGDLQGTLFNIVLEAMPEDADDDPIHPSELVATIAALRAEVAELVEGLRACRRATLHGADEPRRNVREIVDEALAKHGASNHVE